MNDNNFCPKTGKQIYTTKKDAQTVVNGARVKHWENQAKKIPKRVYKCPFCDYYHLTKEIPENERKRTKAKSERRYTDERRRVERMETVIRRYRREYI